MNPSSMARAAEWSRPTIVAAYGVAQGGGVEALVPARVVEHLDHVGQLKASDVEPLVTWLLPTLSVRVEAMSGIAIITEACIDVKDRACVDVCPVQCIYELDVATGTLRSEEEAGSGIVETTHRATDSASVFGDSILYVNTEECTSCTACYQPDVCPVGAIYSEEVVPDGSPGSKYNASDPNTGHDHSFFVQLSRDVFAD